MNAPNLLETRPKFTKGEICILAHLVLTIIVIIVLLIIYVIHIFVDDHGGSSSVFDTRRELLPTEDRVDVELIDKFPVGLLYMNLTPMIHVCNTLLLTREWSISTGRAAAMTSDPDLAYLLYDWKIKYPYDNAGNKIIRSIVHPHFDRDTFANNVGLVQHYPVSGIQGHKIPKMNVDYYYYDDIRSKNMTIISWDYGSEGTKDKVVVHYVQPMTMEHCTSYIGSIIELRKYEFCFVLKNVNTILGHGAVVVNSKDLTVCGIFTWGERQQKLLPLIVLNLSHFKEWIDNVISFLPLHG